MELAKYQGSSFYGKIQNIVHKAQSMRLDRDYPTDVTFADIVKADHNVDIDSFYDAIGVDPNFDTISNLFQIPERDIRWLVPELFRDSLRLGYRRSPIWPQLTAMEEQTTGLSQVVPMINMSDATPKRVGESETIPVGTLSYGSKKFDIHKFGRGIKLSDEVARYVSLAVISIYFEDFGVKMGMGVDTLAIDTLINGEQADGSEAAPVIGVGNPVVGLTFRDILVSWFRLAVIGRRPSIMLGGENMAIDTFLMPEFNRRTVGGSNPEGSPEYRLNLNVPLPQGANFLLHGNIPENLLGIVDPTAALLKLNAVPMQVESERIVSNQTEAFYASFTLGFAKMFTDAAVFINRTLPFAQNGFPAQMNPYPRVNVLMD
jgi:hypothetical protein